MVPSWNGYPSCLQVAAFTRSGQVQLLGPALSAHGARTHFARQVQGALGHGFRWPRDPWSFLGNSGEKWEQQGATIFWTVGLDEDMEDHGRSANISSSGKFGTEIGFKFKSVWKNHYPNICGQSLAFFSKVSWPLTVCASKSSRSTWAWHGATIPKGRSTESRCRLSETTGRPSERNEWNGMMFTPWWPCYWMLKRDLLGWIPRLRSPGS